MVPTSDHDLAIIGGGPAGYAAALYAAAAGLSVALVEKDKVGGTCLHRGCIPAKELLETAHVHRTVREAGRFGVVVGEPELAFTTSTERMWNVVEQLTRGLTSLLKGRKVEVIPGTGTLTAQRTVRVAGSDGVTELRADHVLVATGSVPRTLPGFDVDGRIVLTSDEVFSLERVPASVAVIGGGAIGCEFASMFADLGASVTVLEAMPQILPGVDPDLVSVVARSFRRRGIDVHAGVRVHGHEPGADGTRVSFGDGSSVDVEAVVVSVGRAPWTEGALEPGCGVRVDDRGYIEVDAWCRTGVDGVWALGDVIATPGLAHVGFAEAICVVKQILGEPTTPVDYERVPWCIYCHPEVAFAGLSEPAAVEAGHDVVVSKHRFSGNGRALIVGDTEGLVKVVAERRPDGRPGRLLGVHLVGPWVTEQLGQGYLAVNWEATVDEVAHFIQPHPTLSELFGETVLSLTGRGLHG